jgi:hypothetical protein
VRAFSVTSGRIVWKDIEHGLTQDLWSRDTGGGLGDRESLGSTTTLGNDYSGGLVASGALTAYLSTDAKAHPATTKLHVVSPIRTATLSTSDASPLGASGDRVLYYRHVGPKHRRGSLTAVFVYDLRTRRSQQIGPVLTTASGLNDDLHSASIWGDRVAYGEQDGSVWSQDLATNTTTELRPPTPGSSSSLPQVFSYRDWVGWNVDSGSAWRNVVSLDPAVTPAPFSGSTTTPAIRGMSVNGVLLNSSSSPYGDGGGDLDRIQAFDQPTGPTVYKGGAILQVDGSTMAWRTAADNVQMTTLPHVVDPPVYLGDRIAPATLATGGSWQAYVPFSAGLTTCSVTYTQGATTLVTHACDSSAMAEGDAFVRWNGKDSGGHQVTGTVTWTLSGGNGDGAAPVVSGSITIAAH